MHTTGTQMHARGSPEIIKVQTSWLTLFLVFLARNGRG
jgi:hypothetical protein